jgi:hypothetical protein
MAQPTQLNAKRICEDLLLSEKRYNIEHNILPSEVAVIDRLLGQGEAMSEVYDELLERLGNDDSKLKRFLQITVNVAAFWCPKRMKDAREDSKRIIELNADIVSTAKKLADLLKRRNNVEENSPFNSNTHYSIIGVIEAATRDNHLFNMWVKNELASLCGRFDLKYWPTLEECVREIAKDSEQATVRATDPLTMAATRSNRPTYADFIRALIAAISDDNASNLSRFKPTDKALATIANCALDLDGEDIIAAENIKAIRNR